MTHLVELKGARNQRFFVSPENVKSIRACSQLGLAEVVTYAKRAEPILVVGSVETLKELLQFKEIGDE